MLGKSTVDGPGDGTPAPLPHPAAVLVDAVTGVRLAADALADRVAALARRAAALPPGVVFLRLPTTVPAAVRYLGVRHAQRAVALFDPALGPALLDALVARYQPVAVLGLDAVPARTDAPPSYHRRDDDELGPLWIRDCAAAAVHPDLDVLLATSGSTGDPKLVRLGRRALAANTSAIVDVLGIGPGDVAVTSLAWFYSFGLSVLNTHLAVGATVVVQPAGLLHPDFWRCVDTYGVTSLSCVPYQFELLDRGGFDPAAYPTLRVLAQAGGRLAPAMLARAGERMTAARGRLYVMYGQTEAGPRMTTLPAHRLADKPGSVGPALPGGRLAIRGDDGRETTVPGRTGEVLYFGPNVMMGYAQTAADLARGDDQDGLLATGDLGCLDEEGFLYLTGRERRFVKVFGVRLNLDDIEAIAAERGHAAAVSGPDRAVVWLEGASPAAAAELARILARRLDMHRSGFDVRPVAALPLLSNGKVDYRSLAE